MAVQLEALEKSIWHWRKTYLLGHCREDEEKSSPTKKIEKVFVLARIAVICFHLLGNLSEVKLLTWWNVFKHSTNCRLLIFHVIYFAKFKWKFRNTQLEEIARVLLDNRVAPIIETSLTTYMLSHAWFTMLWLNPQLLLSSTIFFSHKFR